MSMAALILAAALAAPATLDASGRVVAEDGTPVAGAQVCEITQGAAERCVSVDDTGHYRIVRTTHPTLLVRATGFVPTTVDAAPLNDDVKLRRAATLRIAVVDASTGKPVPEGRVMIDTPSGRRIGNFVPFNQAGVRISTLEPGIVFVRSESDGYDSAGPTPVDLVGGSEQSITIPMTKAGGAPR
jgi:hypothetical protein